MKNLKRAPKETISDLSKLWEIHNNFMNNKQEWIFRGLKDIDYDLKTNLERVFVEYRIKPSESLSFEGGLLRKFKRQAEKYIKHIPEDNEYMEWLSLMQHHGAPTRLMDWTYSFLVSVYFAVVDSPKDKDCVIWALNSTRLAKILKNQTVRKEDAGVLGSDPNARNNKNFELLFIRKKDPYSLVCPMNAYKFNERLTLQQGVFLVPADVGKTFEENFVDTFSDQKSINENVKRYIIKKSIKRKIEANLIRMNLTSATLFPGLDGFAHSLKQWLSFTDSKKILKPEEGYGKINYKN